MVFDTSYVGTWYTTAVVLSLCLVPCLRYSGKTLEAAPWEEVDPIQEILREVERAVGVKPGFFTYVLLNWYRHGEEYVGWHSGEAENNTKGCYE